MKFKISVVDLQYALRIVKDIAQSGSVADRAAGVMLSAEGNKAVFTAYSQEFLAKATVKIVGEEPGSLVLDPSSLYPSVSRFQPANEHGVGTSDISISSSRDARKFIMATTTKYKSGAETPQRKVFPVIDGNYFPNPPDFSGFKHKFSVLGEAFSDGIEAITYALSTDKNSLVFTGILFNLSNSQLTLTATDGVCLAEYKMPVTYAGEGISVVVPGALAGKISRSFFEGDVLDIYVSGTSLFVNTPNLLLGGPVLQDEYPDYKAVLPEVKHLVSLDKNVILDNLLNLNYEASVEADGRTTFEFYERMLSLTCGQSTNKGMATDFSGSFTVDCNHKFLVSSIKNIFGGLKIGIPDSSEKPITFYSTERTPHGGELMALLVPLSED